MVSNNEALGWLFGKWFVGFVQVSGDGRNKSCKAYLFAHKALYEELTRPKPIGSNPVVKQSCITVYDRCGHYDYLYYSDRRLDVTDFNPTDIQQKVIYMTTSYFKEKKNAVVLLSGPSNAGKSMIAILLAKALEGSIVYEFNPTEPGNNFNTLYNKASPTYSTPLIATFEEVDGMIDAIHFQKITRHESKPITVHNKATWNTFMDNIDHKFYPNVIFFFTTNRPLEYFDELDPSYMRTGRVGLKIRMDLASCELVASDSKDKNA